MSFNNRFFLGVTGGGYCMMAPPRPGQMLTDDEALELAALIVVMKPQLREKFDAAIRRMEEG